MDRDEIEALEPKYTGNLRRLTAGEAAEILRDQEVNDGDDEFDADDLPPVSWGETR